MNHSCKVKKGDYVLVLTGTEGVPLVREIAAEIGRVGGYIGVMLADASVSRAHILAAGEDILGTVPRQVSQMIESMDALISIISSSNTKETVDVPVRKAMLAGKAQGSLNPIIERKRWNITLHPTRALAQEAEMSFEAYEDFVYGAVLVDWPAMGKKMEVLAERLGRANHVRIVGEETDLSMSVGGRKPVIDYGEKNLPGGEVFTSPVEESVNGTIYFDKPIIFQGKEVKGVKLTLADGVIVKHEAEAGGDLFDELQKTDDGARRMGELGIGMNRGIAKFTKNTLFDEKMGDTIHMAAGMAFNEAGGKNVSALHIDMIKGMKEGGQILFDDEPIYSEGKFAWE